MSPKLFSPAGTPAGIRALWSYTLSSPARGLVLAREKGTLLCWEEKHRLNLFDQAGSLQAERQFASGLAGACCADDGSACAALGAGGEVWWLAPDLAPRWQRAVPERAIAAAMDPFGQYLAVSGVRGGLQIFDRHGQNIAQVQVPRPLHHLAFVPAGSCLVCSADFGLVACVDLKGHWIWRDGLVIHVGSLSVSGDGGQVVVACFTEGLHRYDLAGKNLGRLAVAETCRLAAMSFDGRSLMVTGLSNRILLLDQVGGILCTHSLDKPAAALALGALGTTAYVALTNGQIIGLDLKGVAPR